MERDQRRGLVAGGVIALAMIIAGVVVLTNREPGAVPGNPTSTLPESWDLPGLHGGGGNVSLASFRGKPVVVNLFASWCTACRGELPGLARISQQTRGRVTFIGVASRENGDGYAMAAQYGITAWPLARDVGGVDGSGLHDALHAPGMPATAFYDPRGHLLGVSISALTEDALREKLKEYYGISV